MPIATDFGMPWKKVFINNMEVAEGSDHWTVLAEHCFQATLLTVYMLKHCKALI